jgi:hypothetical protein
MLVRSEAPSDQAANQAAAWPQDIFNVLERFDVRQVPYVPDAGHSALIRLFAADREVVGGEGRRPDRWGSRG